MDFQSQQSSQDLAYDLRQRYAKIVGDHLDDIAYHRKARSYSDYFRALEDLYTIVQHKFKEKKEKKKKEDPKAKPKEKPKEKVTYGTLRAILIKVSNKNSDTWGGNGQDLDEIAEIEKALRDIEQFLLGKMDENNMFGSKREMEGLV